MIDISLPACKSLRFIEEARAGEGQISPEGGEGEDVAGEGEGYEGDVGGADYTLGEAADYDDYADYIIGVSRNQEEY